MQPTTSAPGPDDANDVGDAPDMEGKARLGRRAARLGRSALGGIGGGVIRDSLGRRWNPLLHPRDSRGRFIETGGMARLFSGGRGRVVRALAGARVLMKMDNGDRKTVPARQITMLTRPDGSKPTQSMKRVQAEDARRDKDPKRGNGTTKDDDRDGDGIPDKVDSTPDGDDKPAKKTPGTVSYTHLTLPTICSV